MSKMKFNRRSYLYLATAIVLIGALSYGAFRLTRHNSPTIPSANPIQNQPASKPASASQNSGNSTSNQSTVSTAPSEGTTASGPPPLTPYGDFVSNHHPDGSSVSEASTCNTSPGAVCYIEFTKDAVVKKLTAHTTDGRGGAIWYWNIGDAGLSSGSWTITAVATLNGQTKTANDAQDLVIQ